MKWYLLPFTIIPLVLSAAAARSELIVDDEKYALLEFCNKTNREIRIILIHRHLFEFQKWVLNGWFPVNANSCREITKVPRGYYYFHARSADKGGVWSGKDRYICVPNRQVERTLFEKELCLVGEMNLGFTERLVKGPKATMTLNE